MDWIEHAIGWGFSNDAFWPSDGERVRPQYVDRGGMGPNQLFWSRGGRERDG